MRVKLLLLTSYLNGGLHAVSVGKPFEQMSNFWTVRFLKIESELTFGFPHIPSTNIMQPCRCRGWDEVSCTQVFIIYMLTDNHNVHNSKLIGWVH